jgi:type II secretory pathway component PulJ
MTAGSSVQPDSRQGMSLIELLLALVIVILVVTTAMTLYHTVSSTLRGQTDRLEGMVPVSDAIRQLSRDLTCAFAPPGQTTYSFTLKPAETGQEPSLELSFFTAVSTSTEREIPWGAIRHVTYAFITNASSGQLTLNYRTEPVTGPGVLEPSVTNAVVTGLQNLKVEVFDGKTWHAQWPVEESPVLPQALRIEVQTGRSRSKILTTEVFIPAGNSIPSTLTRSTATSSTPAP